MGWKQAVIFTLMLIALCLKTNRVESQTTTDIYIQNLERSWKDFVSNPTDDGVDVIYSLLPNSREDDMLLRYAALSNLISEDITILESRVYNGERNSIKLVFKFFTIANRVLREPLIRFLGNLLRFNTQIFLEELKIHYDLVPNLSSIVCSFQFTNPTDKVAQELERKLRISALRYVQDKELKLLRNECIRILKKFKVR